MADVEIKSPCAGCGGACCKVLCFPADTRFQVEHLKARGAIIVGNWGFFHNTCKYLDGGLCKIHTHKPIICATWLPGNPICKAAQKAVKVMGL